MNLIKKIKDIILTFKEIVSLKKKTKLKKDFDLIKKIISNKVIIFIIRNILNIKKRVIQNFVNIIKRFKISNY